MNFMWATSWAWRVPVGMEGAIKAGPRRNCQDVFRFLTDISRKHALTNAPDTGQNRHLLRQFGEASFTKCSRVDRIQLTDSLGRMPPNPSPRGCLSIATT